RIQRFGRVWLGANLGSADRSTGTAALENELLIDEIITDRRVCVLVPAELRDEGPVADRRAVLGNLRQERPGEPAPFGPGYRFGSVWLRGGLRSADRSTGPAAPEDESLVDEAIADRLVCVLVPAELRDEGPVADRRAVLRDPRQQHPRQAPPLGPTQQPRSLRRRRDLRSADRSTRARAPDDQRLFDESFADPLVFLVVPP